ncbi:5-methylcytosine-specific restriction protein B [Cupriavidus plantarum]|uniref:5-methylcytosine-specific restriction protein B n=1 Tax=Cupriavidus plantarum TaxID=942865 RepID=A0A316F2A1_9BURK|nr:5-methylcytosine-specific restriction protein B [Cupriavidus plantarum]
MGGRSLFLPDEPQLWTPANFGPLIENYVRDPIEGKDDARGEEFWGKLGSQLGRCPPESVALCAEIYWILTLSSSFLTVKYKKRKIAAIWAMAQPQPLPALNPSSPYLFDDALQGIGSTGTAYNFLMWMELAFAIEAFSHLVAMSSDERAHLLGSPWDFAKWFDEQDDTKGRQFYHILTHALFPDEFERVFSEGGKEKLARNAMLAVPRSQRFPRPVRDQALFEARKRVEAQLGRPIDYYVDPPLLSKDLKKGANNDGSLELDDDITGPVVDEGEQGDVPESLAIAPWLPRNRILFGPPGSGKTHEMERIRRERYENGETTMLVSFHPSYAYEDFVEGYRPAAGQAGRLSEKPVHGPFRVICELAHKRPDVRHTLFIDEINRANVAKVFGELITILEPSKRCDPRPRLDFEDVSAAVRLQYSGDKLAVPANLDIIASMNTADRSVQAIDRALRRRFEFIETPANPKALRKDLVGGVDLRALLAAINDRIEFLIDGDHAIGHALLIDVRTLADLRRVFARRIIPLLAEYFFEDLSRAKLALSGSSKRSPFFDERPLDPRKLFESGSEADGMDARISIRPAADPRRWMAADFIRLYLRGDAAEAAIATAMAMAEGEADDEDLAPVAGASDDGEVASIETQAAPTHREGYDDESDEAVAGAGDQVEATRVTSAASGAQGQA